MSDEQTPKPEETPDPQAGAPAGDASTGADAPPPPPPPGDVPPTTGDTAPPPGQPTKDECTMGMLAHLLGILSFVGPLIIWLIKKDESEFVDDQGREALNFQLLMMIAFVALIVLQFVPFVGCFAALALFPLGLVDLIFCILAGVEANSGKRYRYPVNIPLVK